MVTAVPGPQPARRRSGIATALALCCLVLAVPGWASAQTVPPLDDPPPPDTVTKTVKDVLEPVRETVKPVTETVDPVTKTVDEAVKPVKDTVREVTEPVREVTEPVREVVDPVTDVVDPVTDVVDPDPRRPDPRPPTGGTEGETFVPPPGRTTTTTPDRRDQARPRTDVRRPAPARAEGRRRPAPAPSALPAALRNDREVTAAARPVAPAVHANPGRQSVPDAIARAVVDASRAFRFPLLLAAAMLLFLAIQSRLDARDPKLAQTAAEQELTFV